MRRLRLALVLFAMMAAFGASGAHAIVLTDTYTGNNFTSVSGTGLTTSDFLSGSFVIDCGLLGGAGDCTSLTFADYSSAITSYAFFAGGTTIDDSTTFLVRGMFSTDATGMLIGWDIETNPTVPSFATISGTCFTFFTGCDLAKIPGGTGFTFNKPGVWSVSAVSIPEPPSLAIVLVGLIDMLLLLWRHRASWLELKIQGEPLR